MTWRTAVLLLLLGSCGCLFWLTSCTASTCSTSSMVGAPCCRWTALLGSATTPAAASTVAPVTALASQLSQVRSTAGRASCTRHSQDLTAPLGAAGTFQRGLVLTCSGHWLRDTTWPWGVVRLAGCHWWPVILLPLGHGQYLRGIGVTAAADRQAGAAAAAAARQQQQQRQAAGSTTAEQQGRVRVSAVL
jgi:hypothetical protein